ncbi:Uncharacterized protein PHSC3_001336 [Chlamydiales bacterium STE3]|nr:Uncharacterized protein PHSC3_001336 [Chlamydiales bacterium STE3]
MDVVIQKHSSLNSSVDTGEFLTFAPYSLSAKEQMKNALFSRKYPRTELEKILTTYNTLIENDAKALENCVKLRDQKTLCVITGQKLGLMGGPACSILKGLSCLLLAKELNAIPIYWLATEDHDLHEIDHTYLIDSWGNLKDYKLHFPERPLSVEDLVLNEKHHAVIDQFLEDAAISFSFGRHPDFATTMASFLAKTFQGTGMVFVEPKLLRDLSKPFFFKELRNHQEILAVLKETKMQLVASEEQAPLPVEEGPQLFFKTSKGSREKIKANKKGFEIGGEVYSLSDLEVLLEKNPERFSSNAFSRPVLQSAIFPTAAYVAGPTELNYYRQLKEYHFYHEIPMPWIVPRLSGTFLTPEAADLFHKLALDPSDPIPRHWAELMPQLHEDLEQVKREWEHVALRLFSEELTKKTLDRSMSHLLRKLEKQICKARLQKLEVPLHALHYLRNLLHPHQQLQERVLNWSAFQATCKKNLINECLRVLKWDINGHFYFAI